MEELKKIGDELLQEITEQLLKIRLDKPNPEHWSQASVPYLQQCLERLYQAMIKYPFAKRTEEIHFFKDIKPAVMAQLIFMCEVHNKEIHRPGRNIDKAKRYLADELVKIDGFFTRNKILYDYYKEKLDVSDIIFFVRNVKDRFNFRDLPIEVDPVYYYGPKDFSTGLDFMFAKFSAYEMLRDHLEIELEALQITDVPPDELKFTGSPADFVQLVEIFGVQVRPVDPDTGEPMTEQKLFELLKQTFNPSLPNGLDFNTLKLISGNSDLIERMSEAMKRKYKQWEDDERDIDYRKDEDVPGDGD